jgi:hypothetical protein
MPITRTPRRASSMQVAAPMVPTPRTMVRGEVTTKM